MTRLLTEKTLLIATHNEGKRRELQAMLAPFGVDCRNLQDFGLPAPEETGKTFADNATIKALAAARATQLPALGDDSGLAVSALSGAPGIATADWAGPQRDYAMAMRRIWDAIEQQKDRGASFICSLALAWPDGHAEAAEGRVDGEIVWPPRGGGGFGYDPFFIPKGYAKTFAELPPEVKESESHRGRALRLLIEKCLRTDAGR